MNSTNGSNEAGVERVFSPNPMCRRYFHKILRLPGRVLHRLVLFAQLVQHGPVNSGHLRNELPLNHGRLLRCSRRGNEADSALQRVPPPHVGGYGSGVQSVNSGFGEFSPELDFNDDASHGYASTGWIGNEGDA